MTRTMTPEERVAAGLRYPEERWVYLKPTDPLAFQGVPMLPQPSQRPDGLGSYMKDHTALCPQCQGHGYWVLEFNAYRKPGAPESPAGHHGLCPDHFHAACNQCNGWGWVRPEDAEHVHEWEEVYPQPGNCLHNYRCKLPGCSRTMQQDSSG
jgi:hypothetical protein